jgi:adenine-specific DNA-methyltransferase
MLAVAARYGPTLVVRGIMQNLLSELEALLQADQSLISDGKLLKSEVIARADRMDPGLLKLLLQSASIRAHFFTEINGTMVFDKVKFGDFVSNKAFLSDSYTAFRNRIGLMDGRGRYLKDSGDVVLAWPYKDCVLEGGMTKEDAKRDEVFWNTTLAPDDITRLFEPKALIGFELWDAEAVAGGRAKRVETIAADDNLLIKGNNLLALHSLKARYARKVKLIYIDPPYNTENEGFGYNDTFEHSSWLTFMRNRLTIARELLSDKGVIVVNLDKSEAHYCKVLMDEIFGRDSFVIDVAWQRRDGPPNDKRVGPIHDHTLIYTMQSAKKENGEASTSLFLMSRTEKADAEYRLYEEPFGYDERGPFRKVDPTGNAKGGRYVESLTYGVENPFTGEIVYPRKGRCWVYQEDEMKRLIADRRYFWGKDGRAGTPMRKLFKSEATRGMSTPSIWDNVGFNQHAARELELIFGEKAAFDTPKPEGLMKRIIEIGSQPGDLVLDFFLGSGTTAAVAHKMGRRWIGIDQMDYVENITASRLKKVIEGEQGGVSKANGWQGGGSFIYLQLAEWNEKLAKRIREARDDAALDAVIADVRVNGYWRYDAKQKLFNWEAFAELTFGERKQVLLDSLDANHLYVNYSDIADEAYGISDEEIRLNQMFYQGGE